MTSCNTQRHLPHLGINHLLKFVSIILRLTHTDSSVSAELIEQLNFVVVRFLLPDSQKSCHWYSQSVVAALPRLPLLSMLHAVFTPILTYASAFHRFTFFPPCLAFLSSLLFFFVFILFHFAKQKLTQVHLYHLPGFFKFQIRKMQTSSFCPVCFSASQQERHRLNCQPD